MSEVDGLVHIAFESVGAARLIVPGEGAVYVDAGRTIGNAVLSRTPWTRVSILITFAMRKVLCVSRQRRTRRAARCIP
jgi:hypothetical protein